MWPLSKYSEFGPPMHLQPVAAVASTDFQHHASTEVEVEVAAPPLPPPLHPPTASTTPAMMLPPWAGHLPTGSTAPPALPRTPLLPQPPASPPQPVESQALLDPPPGSPTRAALKMLRPPAPVIPSEDDKVAPAFLESAVAAPARAESAVAAPARAGSAVAVAAQDKVIARLLALAREIRRPRSYVGYSAFVLMGLLNKARPCVWEGSSFIDLLETFAPWAVEHCVVECAAHAIPCASDRLAGGSGGFVQVSEGYPLSRCNHYIAGVRVPLPAVASEHACGIETFYAKLGIATSATVVDGDCGLDVMQRMLSQPGSYEGRVQLRTELSDYLIERIREPWMHELMVACQELRKEDAEASTSTDIEVAPPTAPAPAVAEGEEEQAELMERAMPDEETFAAMRWASRLPNDSAVLGLIRSLPNVIVEEQLRLYRQRPQETAVAEEKIRISPSLRLRERMLVAQRFDTYCQRNGIGAKDRMPRGTLRTFVEDHIDCSARNVTFPRNHVRKWHRAWLRVSSRGAIQQGHTQKRSRLKSRAHKAPCRRVRAHGGGRPCKAPLIRQELYEWWSSMRYAIDWKELIAARRSRGKKQNLARFPRAILVIKVTELLESHAYASLLNGGRLQSFNPDSRWFAGWEEEYGLSMRLANRKYQVPRPVLKERLEIFWANLFRLRLLIQHVFGYDPVILNFDQSPFHHNESGAQNKRTLSLRGCTVPIVEGNTDVKSRWTANLSTCSKFAGGAGAKMPFCEMLFKGATDGIINARLQEFPRRRQFPSWFSVAVAPKGSYPC